MCMYVCECVSECECVCAYVGRDVYRRGQMRSRKGKPQGTARTAIEYRVEGELEGEGNKRTSAQVTSCSLPAPNPNPSSRLVAMGGGGRGWPGWIPLDCPLQIVLTVLFLPVMTIL